MKNFIVSIVTLTFFSFVTISSAKDFSIEFRLQETKSSIHTIEVQDVDNESVIHFLKEPVLSDIDIERAAFKIQEPLPPETREALVGIQFETIDEEIPVIYLHLNDRGGDKLADITSNNVGKRLGTFINQKLIIAPFIRVKIDGGVVSINGAGTLKVEEAKELVKKINQTR